MTAIASADTTTLPPPAAPDSVIVTAALTKHFGEQVAIEDINLAIPAGTIVGLIGPSGCGKTTLIRTLIGVIPPTSGQARVFGEDPAVLSARQRTRFGYMPQMPVLFPNLSLWGNVNFVASLYGVPLIGRRKRLNRVLDLVGLTEHRSKQLAHCSGGMQRRLTLAATLVHDPELLYLDEPTAGVDPILRERFWAHFRSLRDEGRTIVVPTQYVGEAVNCDLVAVMSQGRLITVQPPARLARVAYGGDVLVVSLNGGWLSSTELHELRRQPFVRSARGTEDGLLVVVDDAPSGTAVLSRYFEEHHIETTAIAALAPDFDQIFVELIESRTRAQELEPA